MIHKSCQLKLLIISATSSLNLGMQGFILCNLHSYFPIISLYTLGKQHQQFFNRKFDFSTCSVSVWVGDATPACFQRKLPLLGLVSCTSGNEGVCSKLVFLENKKVVKIVNKQLKFHSLTSYEKKKNAHMNDKNNYEIHIILENNKYEFLYIKIYLVSLLSFLFLVYF